MSRLLAGATVVVAVLAWVGVGSAVEAPLPRATQEAADTFPHRQHQD